MMDELEKNLRETKNDLVRKISFFKFLYSKNDENTPEEKKILEECLLNIINKIHFYLPISKKQEILAYIEPEYFLAKSYIDNFLELDSSQEIFETHFSRYFSRSK